MQARLWVLAAVTLAAFPAAAFAPVELAALPESRASSAAPEDADAPHMRDAEGDARDRTTSSTVSPVAARCSGLLVSAPAVRPTCGAAHIVAGAAPEGGVPAPPGLDLVAGTFDDTPDSLVITVETAAPFRMADFVDAEHGLLVGVCWNTDGEDCSEQALVFGWPSPETPHVYGYLFVSSTACNVAWNYCQWAVEFDDADGTMRWTIPHALLPNGSAGTELADPYVYIGRFDAPGDVVTTWSASGPFELTGWFNTFEFSLVDFTEDARPVVLEQDATPLPRGTPRAEVPRGDILDLGRGDRGKEALVDILGYDLVETDRDLRIVVTVDEVAAEPPAGLTFYAELGLGDYVYEFWGGADADGTYSDGAYYCANDECTQARAVPFDLTFVPGTPGSIEITVARVDVGAPPAGALVEDLAVLLGHLSITRRSAGPAAAEVLEGAVLDIVLAGPQVLEHPTADAGPGSTTVVIADALDDIERPVLVSTQDAARFDITFLSGAPRDETTSALTLGIRDLSRVTVPLGYDGVFYAVGMAAPAGAFMAGYYKDSARQEFFCSPDTAVLAAAPVDPDTAVWLPIEGIVAAAAATPTGDPNAPVAASSGGSITFFVPHECFGKTESGQVAFSELAAATYLLTDPTGRADATLVEVDRVDSEGPVELAAFEPTVAAASPFWRSGDFWNVFGIAAAAVTSIAGAAIVQRKRQILKRYLSEIDHAVAANADAKDREIALAAIELRLKRDLMRGAIAEGHYVIVERRLGEHLGSARAQVVAESFGDMPHKLLVKLQQILADGVITRDEARVFAAYLEDSGLTEEARARIRRKLDLWVDERSAAEAKREA